MRCLIIHNPSSGPHSDEIFNFARALSAAGDEVVMRFIGDGMEPVQATEDAIKFDRVVASGGDGTISNILYCLRHSGVPVLVFPSGTANLFFNNIGNAPEAAALAHACRKGTTKRVDMGELSWFDNKGTEHTNGFIIIAGCGFDASIMQKAEPNKEDMGEIAYFISALSTPEPTIAHFHIEHDGIVEEFDGIGCLIGNTALIQNDINLLPHCRMNDGLLDVGVIQPAKTMELLPTLVAGVLDPKGKDLGRPQFSIFQTKEATITCTPELDMEFDGELIRNSAGPLRVRVLEQCLDIIVDDFSNL